MLGTKNRFAALKIDDDDDESPKAKGAPTNQNQSNSAAKKKNKKKTKEADEALRSMAFGTGRPGTTKHQQKQPGNSAQQQQPKTDSAEEWARWQRKDIEVTEDMYEKDLQMALLASRQEAELKEQIQKQAAKEGQAVGDSGAGAKKKKKKDKPQAMTLGTFQQLPPETLPGSDDENEEQSPPPPVQMRVPIDCKDEQYFQNIDSAAIKIVQRERIHEQYQKDFARGSVINAKYEEQIEQLQKEKERLKSTLAKQAEELKNVKERNVHLCQILKNGEMKDKKTILMQVEELTADKEHLTDQLGMLQAELEKERSKNHALKLENDKFKGKHGK